MLKELMENMDKELNEMRKRMYGQNQNINKEDYKKELKRNSGAEDYNSHNLDKLGFTTNQLFMQKTPIG